MLSKNIELGLNNQMSNEFCAEYAYLAMASYFHYHDLDGIANYFHVQSSEERTHAMRIYNFILNKLGKITLKTIEAPVLDFKSPIEVFEQALAHEEAVTKSINHLMDIAIKENDHAVNSFLRWYVDEQVEEEALANKSLNRIKMVGGKGEGLLILDQEFGKRSLTNTKEK